jgi:hypothetical protein
VKKVYRHIKNCDISHIEKIVMPEGELKIVTAAYYEDLSNDELSMFALKHALYSIPTIELINFLKKEIGDEKSVLEIGSGNGFLGKALNIKCTDNKMQDDPAVKLMYKNISQPTIKYGDNVEKIDAEEALRKYHPGIVIASWVTQKYCPVKNKGNVYGPDLREIVKNCQKFILIGNDSTHGWFEIMQLSHRKIEVDGYISRASNPQNNYVYIWEKK